MRLDPIPAPWADVELWRIDLDQPCPADAAEVLSPVEQARAQRFLRPADAHRYRIGRLAMRQQLAAVLGCPARSVPLVLLAHGKPALDPLDADAGWQFNLAHSGSLGLFGLARGVPVGVDIECPRPMDDLEALARAHFTAREQASWASVSAAERLPVFLRVWTRKEACLKAWGTGLSLPTRCVDVGVGPGERIVPAADPSLAGVCRVRSLRVPDNPSCEAAVALGTAGGTRHA